MLAQRYLKPKVNLFIIPHSHFYSIVVDKKYSITNILKWIIILLLLTTLSSPVIQDKYVTQNTKGHNIVLVVDTSQSMGEYRYDRQNRTKTKFDILKDVISDFIKKRTNDNVALVAFGDFSFILSPLSFDKQTLLEMIKYLKIGIAGDNTALFDGLVEAVRLLKKENIDKKVIIFLTDGKQTAGKIKQKEAIELAKKYSAKIYTIGMGDGFDYDRDILTNIAKETDGIFFQANSKKELQKVYEKIDQLEKTDIRKNQFVKNQYLYQYFLILAIIFMLIYIYLKNRR
jgi:Ca-activated chloride channel family protein